MVDEKFGEILLKKETAVAKSADEEEPGSGMNEVVLKEVAKPPSMWDYSPRGLPKEFVGVDRSNFLVNPFNMNLCFLGKDILTKICSMLSPADFVNLSLACRYLHWRIFTFCTCYVDYEGMEISDAPLSTTVDDGSKNIRNWRPINFTTETAYYLDLDYCNLEGAAVPYHDEHVDHRGVLVWHDKYLRKPFLCISIDKMDDFGGVLFHEIRIHLGSSCKAKDHWKNYQNENQ